jgi:hypothetical protein
VNLLTALGLIDERSLGLEAPATQAEPGATAQGMTDDPIVVHNLKYWGAPRNKGFILMANEVEAYRAGSKPYEFRGTNGFMITVDIASKDIAGARDAGAKSGY